MKTLLLILQLFYFQSALGQIQKADCETLVKTIAIEADPMLPFNTFENEHKKIGKIENSIYDFEIRYYLTPSIINAGHVIIINCTQDGLQARKVNYWFKPNKSSKERKINKIIITDLHPRHTWEAFMDSLQAMNFFAFPSMEEIRPRMKKYMTLADGRTVEKRSEVMDGAIYTFQVKIGNKIRTFGYHSPIAWYKAYDHVEELKIAEDIKNHFVNNLTEKENKRR